MPALFEGASNYLKALVYHAAYSRQKAIKEIRYKLSVVYKNKQSCVNKQRSLHYMPYKYMVFLHIEASLKRKPP